MHYITSKHMDMERDAILSQLDAHDLKAFGQAKDLTGASRLPNVTIYVLATEGCIDIVYCKTVMS